MNKTVVNCFFAKYEEQAKITVINMLKRMSIIAEIVLYVVTLGGQQLL